MIFPRQFRWLLILIVSLTGPAQAQDRYPSKPLRIIVTLSAGSQVDILARLVADKLSQSMGQPVVVENKVGAGGTLATAYVASAPPDGYTFLMAANGHAINPSLYPLRYDTARDLKGVSLVAVVPSVLVTTPSLPANSAAELISLLREKPGAYNYASPGIGSAGHMATELFNLEAKVKATHVSYKGTPEAFTDLIGGNVQYFFAPLGPAMSLITTGKVKALAVSTSERSPALPHVATVAESGLPGYRYDFWYGLIAPSGTPKDIVDRVIAEVQRALAQPDVREKLAAQGAMAARLTGADFDRFIQDEMQKSATLVKLSGAANTAK